MASPEYTLSRFDARPGQSLYNHLDGVATNVSHLLADAGTTAYGDDWQTVGQVLAWAHDAGKLTDYFQQYLRTNDRSHAPTHEHTYHGFVGALLTAHVLYELDVAETTRQAGFYAVAKHHGVLPDVPDRADEYDVRTERARTEQQFDVVADQLSNIDSTAADAVDALLQKASGGAAQWADVPIEQPQEYSPLITLSGSPDKQFYETLLRAWSTLVCADKLDASNITVTETTKRPSLSKLREHVTNLPDGTTPETRRLNSLRTAAHAEAKETMRAAHAADERLFRITLPTGFGKTLTGLRAALEVADDIDGRVIYGLPYTSIIDQIHGEIRDIFDVSAGDPEYTIHHHLADTWTRLDEIVGEERVSDGSESLYAETWQSGVVLTTFVQLFESLAGPTNVQSMKLPAFQDSVIILDEPQALSLRWWSLVGRLAKFLRDEYDASVVLMTATQPEIFERDTRLPDPTSATTQYGDCCSFIADHPRVEFHLDESLSAYLDTPEAAPRDISEAADRLVSDTVGGAASAPTTLAIANTVESAASLSESVIDAIDSRGGDSLQLADHLLSFYRTRNIDPTGDSTELAEQYLEALASQAPKKPACLVATLTAQLRPIDRALLLDALRRRLDADTSTPLDDIPLVTVSTQLIEAGVDISFDRLYRDLGPIPALVQAAGRCNRNFTGEVSPVTVWRLGAPDDETIPSDLIYGSRSLLRPTRHALQDLREGGTTKIPEATMISEGVSNYYESLHDQRRTDARTSDLVEQFDTARGASLREASLIEEYTDTQDVAVLVSDVDREAYESYRSSREVGDWQDADRAFETLKQVFVSVPTETVEDDPESAFTTVDLASGRHRYAIRTGRGIAPE